MVTLSVQLKFIGMFVCVIHLHILFSLFSYCSCVYSEAQCNRLLFSYSKKLIVIYLVYRGSLIIKHRRESVFLVAI